MALEIYFPEQWAAMKQSIYDWLRTELGVAMPIMWAKQQAAPSPARPYAAVSVLVPPIQEGQADHFRALAIAVSTVLASTDYTVTIDGVAYVFNSGLTPTATTIRDGLIALINAGVNTVSAESFTDASFLILPDHGTTRPPITAGANLALKMADSVLGDAMATFQIDVYDDPVSDVGGGQAMPLAARLQRSLEKESVLELLRAAGWAFVSIEGVRKPDLFIGARWEDRAGFDVQLRCRTRVADLLDYIEDAGTIVGTFSTA